MQNLLLRMEGISKNFPGVNALCKVDFHLQKGEVHLLLGENGAGKTTLMNILRGVYKPDEGEIYFEDKKVNINNPKQAEKLGIGMVHQEPELVPCLNAAENIFLGKEIISNKLTGRLDTKKMQKDSIALLHKIGAEIDMNKKIKDMSMAEKQYVSIARSLVSDSKIIIFDEPTASLTDMEIGKLFDVIRELKSNGKSIIYISHRLKEYSKFGDRITVLKDGCVVATQCVGDAKPAKIIRMMLGKDMKDHYPKLPVTIGEEMFRVENLCTDVIRNINFSMYKGEILGMAGLVGSGRTNLARTIMGMEPLIYGKFFINQSEKRIQSALDAIQSGIGYISENRNEQGLFNIMSVYENTTIANIDCVKNNVLISAKKEKSTVRNVLYRLGVKKINIGEEILFQSGGNKQKIILARWLLSRAKIFIFDEPTHGLDLQSKVEVYNLMNEIVKNGGCILMISSDISELVGMSNRILVMYKGQIIGEMDRNETSQEKVYYFATGGQNSM